jgi:hypothetical protein
MPDFNTARKIALLILLLKDRLKGRHSKLSDKQIAKLLSEAIIPNDSPLEITPAQINKLWHPLNLSDERSDKILHAIQAVMQKRGIDIKSDIIRSALPNSIDRQYGPALPSIFKHTQVPYPLQGEKLGGLNEIVTGLWRCFYISPVNSASQFKPEIRGFPVFFRKSDPDQTAIDTIVFAGKHRWEGISFVLDFHLYIVIQNEDQTETVSFVTNRPTRALQKVAGIGTALERQATTRPRENPSVVGIICFGEKCSNTKIDQLKLTESVDAILRGEAIPEAAEDKIREEFCSTHKDADDVKRTHPGLYAYMSSLKTNNQSGFPSFSLHLTWP